MKINWKLRLKNRVTLTAIIAGLVQLAYTILGWCEIVPPVASEDILQTIDIAIGLLILLGVVVDPTTEGIDDSDRAMNYPEPRA